MAQNDNSEFGVWFLLGGVLLGLVYIVGYIVLALIVFAVIFFPLKWLIRNARSGWAASDTLKTRPMLIAATVLAVALSIAVFKAQILFPSVELAVAKVWWEPLWKILAKTGWPAEDKEAVLWGVRGATNWLWALLPALLPAAMYSLYIWRVYVPREQASRSQNPSPAPSGGPSGDPYENDPDMGSGEFGYDPEAFKDGR